ncbi:MAG: MATE family efflux transporter [Candidatus Eremiobacteraeota bacterium]|nr:MATE family efflux transporter [Candidatus Eremiobacteraeota bacterium]
MLSRLLALAGPVVLANLLQTAYQFIDTVWVGRVGPTAVAAVSLSFPILFLMISLGGGLAIAGTILVAQYQGRKDTDQVNLVAGQTLLAMLCAASLVSLLGYFVSGPIIGLMVRNADANLVSQATIYLQWTFIALPTLFIFAVFQSLMRGVGDVVTPLYIVGSTVLLNLVLDPFFIFTLEMGVAGAAVATLCTQSLAALAGIWLLFTGRAGIHLSFANLRPRWDLLRRMFFLGLPASIEQSSRALGITMMAFLVANYPTSVVAAYGVGSRVLGFVIIPALGLSMAASTMVGQNLGANKPERAAEAVKLAAWSGFVVLTAIGALTYLGSDAIAAFFVPDSGSVITQAGVFLRIVGLSFGCIGVQQVLNGAFRGSGNTMISMILSILSLWVFQFPVAYVLSDRTPLAETGIWWSYPIANVVAMLVALLWFSHGSWREKKLLDEVDQVQEETMVEFSTS